MLNAVQTTTANDDLAAQAAAGLDVGVTLTESRSAKNISIGSMTNTFVNDFNSSLPQESTGFANPMTMFANIISSIIQGLFNLVGQLITALVNQKNQTANPPATTTPPATTPPTTTPPKTTPPTPTPTPTPTSEKTDPVETKPEDKTTEPTDTAPTDKSTPASRPLKKSGEFLWKPASEKDGNLVILCRSAHTGNIASVKVLDPKTKKVLAKGKQAGVANGNREHFRFDKPGKAFPDGAIVEITLKNSEKRTQVIKNTDQRFVR